MTPEYYLGLLSGTSLDGIDAVLVNFGSNRANLLAAQTYPFPAALLSQLQQLLIQPDSIPAHLLANLDACLGQTFAQAAEALISQTAIDKTRIKAIGSHGLTILHAPHSEPPYSIQLGDPNILAEYCGLPVVADFRRADIAAGGQGAPLAPLLHRLYLAETGNTTGVVNLGGIANLTVIDSARNIMAGFDTGPANCLLDAWHRKHHQKAYDHRGQWAASGQLLPELLDALLQDPYFALEEPKSTGTDYFNLAWLNKYIDDVVAAGDIQATLLELTAQSIYQASKPYELDQLLVCGGGIHNRTLIQRIRQLFDPIPVLSSAEKGLDPDWVEGILFAWLAKQRLANNALDTGHFTGARQPVRLGAVYACSAA